MNKQEHTPGPWTDNVGPTHPHHVIRADGEKIAYTVDHTGTSAGNARLIAAAPELLDALRLVLAHDGALTGADWTAIRAAIAKAEGEG